MFKFYLGCVLAAILCVGDVANAELKDPIVSIKSGQVRGFVGESIKGKPYYGFNGIPYVKPPDRFKVAEPVEKWEGVLDATKYGPLCPQFNFTDGYEGSEDCLTINVFTPKLENDTANLLPVLFVIHGGGFIIGSGGALLISPQNLMDYPVVVVAFNYRLGLLGFLNTEDENAHGNYGLLDQVMALKWVQENIQRFNGDPNNVSIFGISAGGASVIFHVLSPLSKGLFHRAFSSSGTAINHWAYQRQPLNYAKQIASHLQCPQPNVSTEIVKCLKDKSAEELINATAALRLALLFPNDPVPSVEPKSGPGFLPDCPWKLLIDGKIANKVPVIMGHNEAEGAIFYMILSTKMKFRGKKYFDEEFASHLPLFTPVKTNVTLAVDDILKNYVNISDNLDDKDTFDETMSLIMGDSMFNTGIVYTAEKLSAAGVPVHFYLFDYIGQVCSASFIGAKCANYSMHGDDGLYYFRSGNFNMTENDIKVGDVMSNLLTSFAAGNDLKFEDGVEWPTFEKDKREYVKLNLKPTVRQGFQSPKEDLWTNELPDFTEGHKIEDEL